MKQAARRPAREFHTSRVSRKAAMEVKPLEGGTERWWWKGEEDEMVGRRERREEKERVKGRWREERRKKFDTCTSESCKRHSHLHTQPQMQRCGNHYIYFHWTIAVMEFKSPATVIRLQLQLLLQVCQSDLRLVQQTPSQFPVWSHISVSGS